MISIISFIITCSLLAFPKSSEPVNHEFYLSMIEVDHRDTTDSVNFTVKVFTDDLENALYNMDETVISFNKATVDSSNLDALTRYFVDHIRIRINGSTLGLDCEDWEIKGESTFISFQAACPTKWNDMDMMVDYFMELFPTQMHIVQVYNLDEKRYIRLNARLRRQAIVFSS
jgi:hypothetical protein